MFKKFLIIFAIFIFLILFSAVYTVLYFNRFLPDIKTLKHYSPPVTSFVYSDNNQIIGKFYREDRIFVPFNKIPKIVVQAFIAAEDEHFYEHKGIDILSIIRALIKDLKAGKIVQGGSTITQQVVKSFFLTPKKTISRKIKEAILAYKIENFLTKNEILTLYLNQIYLGYNSYGVASACRNYFGKDLKDITLAEAAMLAGLPKAPSYYSPAKHFNRAKIRQKYVLNQMVKNGMITPQQAEKAYKQKITIVPQKNYNITVAPYFLDYIKKYMIKKYGLENLLTQGYKIYTTVNLKYQQYAREALRRGLEEYEQRHGWPGPEKNIPQSEIRFYIEKLKNENKNILKKGLIYKGIVTYVDKKHNYAIINLGFTKGYLRYKDNKWISYKRIGLKRKFISKKLSKILKKGDVIKVTLYFTKNGINFFKVYQEVKVNGAIIAIDPKTGFVKAMVGGYDYLKSPFNRAFMAKRLPGSGFKPIIYTAALDKGFTPATIIYDTPEMFWDPIKKRYWKPENYERRFYGPTTLRDALVHSRNVVTVKILKKIGIDYAIKYARKLGIKSKLNRDLTMALGSSAVTLLEILHPYSIFANEGKQVKYIFIKKIVDKHGKVIENNVKFDEFEIKLGLVKQKQVISPQTAYLITSILEDVVKRGTGRRVRALGRPCAGKTGTTNDFKDAWFFGYTPDLVAGVYVGYDNHSTLGKFETGSRAASPIWLYFMQKALANIPPKMFRIPEGIVFRKIDIRNGLLATKYTPKKFVRLECFKKGTEPKEYSKLGSKEIYIKYWNESYTHWYRKRI